MSVTLESLELDFGNSELGNLASEIRLRQPDSVGPRLRLHCHRRNTAPHVHARGLPVRDCQLPKRFRARCRTGHDSELDNYTAHTPHSHADQTPGVWSRTAAYLRPICALLCALLCALAARRTTGGSIRQRRRRTAPPRCPAIAAQCNSQRASPPAEGTPGRPCPT